MYSRSIRVVDVEYILYNSIFKKKKKNDRVTDFIYFYFRTNKSGAIRGRYNNKGTRAGNPRKRMKYYFLILRLV